MREHVKVEVAIEILSMCIAIAISNEDSNTIDSILKLQQKIYNGDIESIDLMKVI